MAEAIRCPSCGASNPAGSQWCGQCLTRFDTPSPPVVAAPVPVVADAPPPKLEAVPSTGVHREGESLVWTCPSCENVNSIDAATCPVCGTALSAIFGARPGRSQDIRTSGPIVGLSVALPGAGHIYARRTPDGIARLVLFAWTFGIGLLLLIKHTRRGSGVLHLLGALYVAAAIGVWGISFIEAQRLKRGDATPVVQARAMLWASAGLTLVLFLGLAAATQSR